MVPKPVPLSMGTALDLSGFGTCCWGLQGLPGWDRRDGHFLLLPALRKYIEGAPAFGVSERMGSHQQRW